MHFKIKFFFIILFLFTIFTCNQPSQADFLSQIAESTTGLPLKIESDDGVEWNRTEKYFIAKKNVNVSRGDTVLHADYLKAYYKEGKDGQTIPVLFIAEGNVKLSSKEANLTCDALQYDLVKKHVTAKGKKLVLLHDNMKLQASKMIHFWVEKNFAEVVGNVIFERDTEIVKSNRAEAYFKKGSSKLDIEKILLFGDVTIVSDKSMITGHKGIYNVAAGKAEIEGDVKISQGPHYLTAEKAEFDLNTKQSFLKGKSSISYGGGNNTVQGILVPGELKSIQEEQKTNAE